MAKDIVENVGLGQIVELLAFSDGDSRREFPQRQTLKKSLGGYVPVNGDRFPTRWRREASVYLGQVRHRLLFQADGVSAPEENSAAVLSQLLHAALVQDPPHLVIVGGVGTPVLTDKNGGIVDEVVKRGGRLRQSQLLDARCELTSKAKRRCRGLKASLRRRACAAAASE